MNYGFWFKVNILYENISEKIKKLAKWVFVLASMIEIFCGIVMINNDAIGTGLFLIIIAPFLTLFSTWILYAFGHLVKIMEDNNKLNSYQGISKSDKNENDNN